MLWFCAPPSDQDTKSSTFGKEPCGEVAWTELSDPRITVCVNGVTCGPEVPTMSWRPAGTERKLSAAVWGLMLTLAVPVSAKLSVAVNWISR
jgi:hypothetical protein